MHSEEYSSKCRAKLSSIILTSVEVTSGCSNGHPRKDSFRKRWDYLRQRNIGVFRLSSLPMDSEKAPDCLHVSVIVLPGGE